MSAILGRIIAGTCFVGCLQLTMWVREQSKHLPPDQAGSFFVRMKEVSQAIWKGNFLRSYDHVQLVASLSCEQAPKSSDGTLVYGLDYECEGSTSGLSTKARKLILERNYTPCDFSVPVGDRMSRRRVIIVGTTDCTICSLIRKKISS